MPKVVEVLVRKEYHGQVWYEPEEVSSDAEGTTGSNLEQTRSTQPLPSKSMDLGRK